ncbi:hypothetical protein [Aureitalea marina]|uniref:Uncharacterized protein n=1 Tax=Aureitalea marina TaxID=930804 RepID=A0A2S7KNC4_9FLAO|nr:hypothetical protein [Aureitalea marina]PQB04111.1 hypothetical protein BST85_03740 [Aureitalea marina]
MHKNFIKRPYIFFLFLTFILAALQLQAQVGINTTTPADGAMLDIESTSKGLLIPRVALTSTAVNAPVTPEPVTGVLVFNTATDGTAPNDVVPGFYWWDGSQWATMAGSNASDWSIDGNYGTDDTVNVFGTMDEQDIIFVANGVERMRLDGTTGFFGINTDAGPEEYLDVNGDVDMGGGADDWDSQGENIRFRARSEDWWIAAENTSTGSDSGFYIGTTQNPDGAQLYLSNEGFLNIGSDNEYNPLDLIHVTNDSDSETATIRIDNTRNGGGNIHTALELWDGSNESSTTTGLQAYFRARNGDRRLELGHAKADGEVYMYSGAQSGTTSAVTMMLSEDGFVGIGEDDLSPNDILHITNDQDDTTTIRLDNSNDGTDVVHTALELWDGSSGTGEMAFFRHNNNTHTLEIGHARNNGQVIFYSGDGTGGTSGNSTTAMTLETDSHVTIETLVNIKPGSAPSSPERGDVYYDDSTNKLRVYTNSGWVDLH